MKKIVTLSLVTLNLLASQTTTSSVEDMFKNGSFSGELRTQYSAYQNDNSEDTYATAVGGALGFELANYKGFGGGVELRTSQDIDPLTGEGDKFNDELSSSKGNYTQLTQAYLSYEYGDFTLSAGRQFLDTPLADSDDIRMIPNSFEAYIVTYKLNDFSFVAGNVQKWQGGDAGLDDGWVKTAKNGVNLGAVLYTNDTIEATLWYYNITKVSNAIYSDITTTLELSKDFSLDLALQYLDESELNDSGVEATIYGVSTSLDYNDFGFTLAYNHSSKVDGKSSFSGFGGGALYTSMDSMILDEIAQDRDADSIMVGIGYELDNLALSYAYGDFSGDKDSLGKEAHIVEQNFCLEYALSDDVTLSSTYVIDDNKDNSLSDDFNGKNLRFFASYSF